MSQRPNVDSPSVCRVALNEEDHEKSSSVVVVVLLIHFSYLVDFFSFSSARGWQKPIITILKHDDASVYLLIIPFGDKISHLILKNIGTDTAP